MRPGFTLMELVIFVAVASMLGLVLIRSYSQTIGVYKSANAFVDNDRRIMLVIDRLERDISGTCMPHYFKKEKYNLPENKATEKKTSIIPKLFYGINSDQRLSEFSCITSTPSSLFDDVHSYMVRVRYQLVPDKNHEGMFVLMRQESFNLDYQQLTQTEQEVQAIEMIDNIQTIEFSYASLDKDGQGVVQSSVWDSQEQLKAQNKNKLQSILPLYVQVKIVLQQTNKKLQTYYAQFNVWADGLLQGGQKGFLHDKPAMEKFVKNFEKMQIQRVRGVGGGMIL